MVLRNNYQARLCACGNELKGQIADIYSPTIGALSYSIVHQVAIIDRMHVRIIDTVEAYLYQTYPSLPAIYIKMLFKVMEACKIPANVVHRIEKYIYGLPDSGRAYYQAYSYLSTPAISKARVIHVFFSTSILILKIASTSGCMWMILLVLLRVHGYLTSSRLLSNLDLR